ncbi:Eukaryotic translation initiation factor 5 [Linum perenne]
MALQNIGASNSDDAFYRYKMPRMVTKIEGRGNGIKTNVVNMVEIAKALARPASYTTKYFGCELGAQSKFDEKTGVSLVNGSHDTAKLAGLLENFIKKYVQCYGCGNPETEIVITKSQMLQLKCAACGFVSDVDMRDKLTTFILKNPPESKKGSKDKKAMRRAEKERMKEGAAADEELKKLKKDGKKKVTSSKDGAVKAGGTKKKASGSDEERVSPTQSQVDEKEEQDDEDDDDDVQWHTDTSAEAARLRIQEQLSAATAEMVMLTTIETEKKAKAVSPQHEDKSKEENGKPASTRSLSEEIKAALDEGVTAARLANLMESLSGSGQEKMDALFMALFQGIEKGLSKEVIKKKKYLVAAIANGGEAQLLLVRSIQGFFEKSTSVKELPLVLKALYDGDVLEEENILQWYQKLRASNKDTKIVKSAEPFIDWLQNAESESEEE